MSRKTLPLQPPRMAHLKTPDPKVEEWTQEPLEAVVEPSGTPEPGKPARGRKKPAADDPPWQRFVKDGSAKRLANFQLPADIDAQLTWAAHKTYGTRTSVIVQAVTEYIAKLLQEGLRR